MGSWVLSIGVAPVGVGGLASALGAQGALLLNGAVLAGISLAAAVGITHPPKDGLRSAFRLYRDQ